MNGKKRLAISLLVVLLIATAGVAYAGWYFRDPVVNIAGTTVTIDIGKNLPDNFALEKPDRVVVAVPRGVRAEVVDAQGSKVWIRHLGRIKKGAKRIPFGVVVMTPQAPRGKHYAVSVVVSNGSQTWEAKGRSGKPIKIKGWVPGPLDGDYHGGHGDD
jgi:hypothetical protein